MKSTTELRNTSLIVFGIMIILVVMLSRFIFNIRPPLSSPWEVVAWAILLVAMGLAWTGIILEAKRQHKGYWADKVVT